MAESSIRMDTHHEDRDIQLHFKLLHRKINFKKSDKNIWISYVEWHTLLTVNLFEMSSLSFAKGQWQQCQFINGLLIYPFFNTELNPSTGQMLKHNHHSGCDSPPQTLPTFYLWYLLGWTVSSLPGACAAPLWERGNAGGRKWPWAAICAGNDCSRG